MCSRNLFCLKGWKREEKHVDWSCAMEIICFVLRGNTWIGHVQWKCFFGKLKSRDTLWLFMCSGNCFFLRGEKSRETCGLVMCNGNVFLGKKKSRDTLWLFMCSGNCFFFCERRKKQRNVWIDHVQWTFVFLREKSKETSTSIMCSGIFLRGNAWFDHAQWTFVFWQKTCGFSMCAGCCLILGCSQTTVSGMEQSAPQSNMEN